MPPGYPPFRHCQLFFTSFPFSVSSIFQFLCRQLTHTAGNTSCSVFSCCQNATLSLFFRSKYSHSFASRHAFFRRQPAASYPHHSYPSTSQNLAFRLAGHTLPVPFSFKAFSAFHQSSHFLPASAGHILPAAFLPILKPEPRTPACRPASLNHQPFPQTPSAISRCLRATSFPLHFAAAFHSSNIPFFLFSFFYSFSFSLFFSFFLLPLFSLFLVYTFFFLAFFYPLFCFLFPTLFFFSLFFISITMHVFRVHHPKG